MRMTKHDWSRKVARLRRAAAFGNITAIRTWALRFETAFRTVKGILLCGARPHLRFACSTGPPNVATARPLLRWGMHTMSGEACGAILDLPSNGIAAP